MSHPAELLLDLTLSPTDAVSRPGLHHSLGQTVVEFDRFTRTHMQRISNVEFSPHALTHIDLPDSVGLSPQKPMGKGIPGTREWLWCEAVIVNLLSKREFLKEYFADLRWPISFHDLPIIRERLSARQTRERLRTGLRIPKRTLSQIAKRNGGFREKLVILHTGWDYFVPRSTELGHPFWVGLHPYFLFPYLPEEAAEFLVDSGALGVGMDTASAEPPEWMWRLNPLLREHLGEAARRERGFGPVHRRLLGRRVAVIENLSIPVSVYGKKPDPSSFAALFRSRRGWVQPASVDGKVLVIPFIMSPQREAVVVKVYFRSNAWQGEGESHG